MTLQVLENASLRTLNTFGVEARARRLVVLDDEAELPRALSLIATEPRPLVLGGGSNLLIVGDVEGTVLQLRTRGRRRLPPGPGQSPGLTRVALSAGEVWDDAVNWTLAEGLPGLENLAMIPGSCGAAAIQNIGAYGVELCDRFDSLRAVNLRDGTMREFSLADCRFGYRDSVFKHDDGAHWLILEIRLTVGPDRAPVLRYADLAERFAADTHPSASAVAHAVRAIRRAKLPDPAVLGNAGSFFKNPVVAAARAQALRASHPGLPVYPADAAQADQRKLSAAWMIDQCGWKGHREGDAGVHAHHALVLVNHGRATGRQIAALAERIRASVLARFGVALEPEPVVVGRL